MLYTMACCGCRCSLLALLRRKNPKETPVSPPTVPETQVEPQIPIVNNGVVTAVTSGVQTPEALPDTLPGPGLKHESPVSPTPPRDLSSKEYEPRQPEELWELAYDRLRSNDGDPKLTKAYEAVLSRIGDKPAQTLSENITEIQEVDDTVRREQLKIAVKKGLKRTEAFQEAIESAGGVLKAVLSAKELIGSALSVFPQAAAAWTGVTLVFEVRRI